MTNGGFLSPGFLAERGREKYEEGRVAKKQGSFYTPVNKHSWLENGPFEDVFPIEHGHIPASYVRNYQRSLHLGKTEVLSTKSWCFGSMLLLFKGGIFQVNQPIFGGVCGTHFVVGGNQT